MENNEQTHIWVAARMQVVDPPADWDPNPRIALARQHQRLAESGPSGFRLQWKWAVLAFCIGVAALTIALPSGRALAQNLWAMIHVANVGFVRANFDALPHSLEAQRAGDPPAVRAVADRDEAAAIAGFTPRLPSPDAVTGAPKLSVIGAMTMGITVRVADLNSALHKVGAFDHAAPPEWDGAAITVHIGPIVGSEYQNVNLLQTPPLVITTPPAFPFGTFVETVLRIVGIKDPELRRLAASMASAPALIFPIEPDESVLLRDVQLRSGHATLVHDLDENDGSLQQCTLLWSTPDRLYALIGKIPDDRLIAIANSIR